MPSYEIIVALAGRAEKCQSSFHDNWKEIFLKMFIEYEVFVSSFYYDIYSVNAGKSQ